MLRWPVLPTSFLSHSRLLPSAILGLGYARCYRALTLRVAPHIEKKRNEYQSNRVFSWHFNASELGNRDTFSSDWDRYKQRIEELAPNYRYIGASDIVDFFPRVYLHRLENSLS